MESSTYILFRNSEMYVLFCNEFTFSLEAANILKETGGNKYKMELITEVNISFIYFSSVTLMIREIDYSQIYF